MTSVEYLTPLVSFPSLQSPPWLPHPMVAVDVPPSPAGEQAVNCGISAGFGLPDANLERTFKEKNPC